MRKFVASSAKYTLQRVKLIWKSVPQSYAIESSMLFITKTPLILSEKCTVS